VLRPTQHSAHGHGPENPKAENTKGEEWLFPHRRNPHMPMTTIQKDHEEALKDAKLESRFRLYDLRHTFGSRSAMAGVDLATLKELMGHSNISITMRYVHPTPEHKQEALRSGAVQRRTGVRDA